MIGTIIYIIGILLCIKAALEILKLEGDFIKKLIFIILLVATSWIGLAVCYFIARDKIAGWVK